MSEVHIVPRYQAWCKPCHWYGPQQLERYDADNDRRVHDAECRRARALTPPDELVLRQRRATA